MSYWKLSNYCARRRKGNTIFPNAYITRSQKVTKGGRTTISDSRESVDDLIMVHQYKVLACKSEEYYFFLKNMVVVRISNCANKI
jgi:hypothetical protein